MRARTFREGSVGLLIIFSLFLFGGVTLWLRGIKFGQNSYKIVVDFPDVNGIQLGDAVRYRGLGVGRITQIKPNPNGVDVVMEIDSSELLIPKNVTIKSRSSGLIGETFIDIIPESQLSSEALSMNPIDEDCDPDKILCNNIRLQGEKGITLDDLIPLTYRFSKLYADPQIFAQLQETLKNASLAAAEVANLSRDTSSLVNNLEAELSNISTISQNLTDIANNTSSQLISTVKQYQTTAEQITQLGSNVNQLVSENKSNLTTTLDNITTTSYRLQNLVVKIDEAVDSTDTKTLIANLTTLTANAAAASENLQNIAENFSNPDNLVSLQQTLDSARVTFDNAQKITSDLESITGDPAFLNNIKILVNGLSNLVSSTEQLERQVQTSQAIEPVLEILSSQSIINSFEQPIFTNNNDYLNNHYLEGSSIDNSPRNVRLSNVESNHTTSRASQDNFVVPNTVNPKLDKQPKP